MWDWDGLGWIGGTWDHMGAPRYTKVPRRKCNSGAPNLGVWGWGQAGPGGRHVAALANMVAIRCGGLGRPKPKKPKNPKNPKNL